MTRLEFNEKVRSLMKRISSSKSLSIELTKSEKEILIYSFYFSVRYDDQKKWAHELADKVSDAENCFKRKGEPEYDHEKALRKAANIMGWTDEKKGKQPTHHPDKERRIINSYRMIRGFFPRITKKDAIEKVYKDFNLEEIEYESKEKRIKRLETKYPIKKTDEEANSLEPDPDWQFEDLDMMIKDLITD